MTVAPGDLSERNDLDIEPSPTAMVSTPSDTTATVQPPIPKPPLANELDILARFARELAAGEAGQDVKLVGERWLRYGRLHGCSGVGGGTNHGRRRGLDIKIVTL